MVFASIKYCDLNFFYRDKGKRKLRIDLVLLFSVPMISKSVENFCLRFITEALSICNFLLSWAPSIAQKLFSWATHKLKHLAAAPK